MRLVLSKFFNIPPVIYDAHCAGSENHDHRRPTLNMFTSIQTQNIAKLTSSYDADMPVLAK